MSAIKFPENPQDTSSDGVTATPRGNGAGQTIQGTSGDDSIVGSADGDWIEGSEGSDIIYGAGTGTTGYTHEDEDTVRYSEELYVFNRSTNENVKAFEVTANADGSVSVVRNDLTGGGVDTLYNISRILFGTGANEVEVQLEPRTQIDTWGEDGRSVNITGGLANDLIQGQDQGDRLSGGEGNDIILGDAHHVAVSIITAAGGHFANNPLPSGGSTQTNFTMDPSTIISANFVGMDASNNTIVNHQITANIDAGATLHFRVDGQNSGEASTKQTDLENQADLNSFAALVSQVRNDGLEVTLWTEHTATINGASVVGTVLLDVIDKEQYSAGDKLEGGKGNDLIDGGLSGNQTMHPWENDNQAKYNGKFENYDLKQINLSDSSGSASQFTDGTSIASWWLLQPQSNGEAVSTFAQLRTALGLDHEQVDLSSGTYTVISDQSGSDGIDLVINVQWLNFNGDWQRLEVDSSAIDWRSLGEPSGNRYEGTIFNDSITGTDGYDDIRSNQGNDLILAGGGGDHINAGSGNDFIDGGANGDHFSGNRWRDSDEVRIDGSTKRYEITQQTQVQVEAYWADHFTNHGQVFNAGQDYFLIEDLSPIFGNGKTLVTNVDRINFEDGQVWLKTSADVWDDQQIDGQDSQRANIQGSQFNDVFNAADFATHNLTDPLWKIDFDGKAGDDVFIGDAMGSQVRDGQGNDMVVGGGSATLSDNYRWFGQDEVRFDGVKQRYQLETYNAGEIVIDASGNTVFDLTDLATGTVSTADGNSHNVGTGHSKVFVVRDLLPDQFQGNGINLLIDVQSISFDDSHINLSEEVYENTWMDPSDPNQSREIHVRGTQFDDVINTESNQITNNTDVKNWVTADNGNDYIFTGGGGDEIRPGKGNDFVDGGASGTAGDSWQRADKVLFEAPKSGFEVTQAAQIDVVQFWNEHFSSQSFTYNNNQSYFFIEDTNPIDGYGKNLVTNIDQISFSSGSEIRLNYTLDVQLNHSNNTDHLRIDGSQFSDIIITAGVIADQTLTSGASLDFSMEGNEGDDVFIGGSEQNHITGGSGNDLLVGSTSFNASNVDDNANYNNNMSRYEISSSGIGDIIYQTAEDTTSAVLFDLSDLSNGNVITADGTVYNVGVPQQTAYVIRDTLSDALGGDGVDLVMGMDSFNFNDGYQRLTPQVMENSSDDTLLGHVQLSGFDDFIDLSAGITTDQGNLVFAGNVSGNAGNDIVIGFQHGTQFTGGAGDDIFISPGNFDGSGDNWWNDNEALFSGPSSRYNIETGYINIDSSNIPVRTSDGDIQWSDGFEVGYQSAIRVTDLLSDALGGDGTDYLIGVHAIAFETGNSYFEVGTTSQSETWDFWLNDNFTDQYDNVSSSMDNSKLVDKQKGSRFDDTLTADSDIVVALPTNWHEVVINPEMLNLALIGHNPVFFEYTNDGQNVEAVVPLENLGPNASITAKLWVETLADANYLSTAVDDPDTIDFSALTGATELHLTTANPNDSNSQLFSHFAFDNTGSTNQVINDGLSYLKGNEGNDTLIGSAHRDILVGGAGNDLLIGGDNGDQQDQARYSGLQSQFSIEPTWVKLDVNNNVLAESTSQTDESYQFALVVTDTDTSASGEGRDILIGIEEIEFKYETITVGIYSSLELQDGYYPGAGNLYDTNLIAFPHFNIKTSDIADTVYVQDILDQYTYTPYLSTSTFGFNLTTDSYRTVTATKGDDTIFGLATNTVWSTNSKGDDVYEINGVALEQLSFTQGYDSDLNKNYVEIEHTPLFDGALDLGTNRLYDFEQVQITPPGSRDGLKFPLTLNPSLENGQWQGYGFAGIEDSLFNDTINDAMITAFGIPPELYQGIEVVIRGGNDTVEISTGSVFVGQEYVAKWDYNNGNDYINTGHGLDIYSSTNNLSEYEIRYFLDANNNKLRDAGEDISLDTFRTDGVTIYDGNNAHGLANNTVINYTDYLATHSSLNLLNGVGEIWDRGAGWFDYNDNYYVEVAHAVPDSLNGTGVDVLHDVEVLRSSVSGDVSILDLLSGSVHSHGHMFPLGWADPIIYNPADVVTQDINSDLTLLRSPAIPSTSRTNINLIDDATSVTYDFNPDKMTYWTLDLEYDGKDNHNTTLIGTDGDITLMPTDALYTAAGTTITNANNAAIADGAPISSLQTQADNFANSTDISFYAQDNVHLGRGNDIINLMGEAQQNVKGGGRLQDNLFLDLPFDRLNISYGELDSSGYITNAESFFADYVGTPNQKYTRVSDKLADDLGGIGINYLLEADWITPDGHDWIAGEMSSWFVDYGDVNRIHTMSTDVDPLFAPSQLPIIQTAIVNGTTSGVIIEPTKVDGVYIGFDDGDYVENLWQQDIVVIGAESSSFSFERVYIGLADDRSDVARDPHGNVIFYQTDSATTLGYSLKSAVLMQDQILDIDGGYGRKLLVDFEQATFNNWDEEIDISHRVDFWNDGDDTGFELKGSFLDDTFVFDQEKFTDLVNQNVNEINIRDGAGNDTNIILSKQLSVNINLDIGDDYVYLGEELGVSLPADNWYQVDLRTYDSSRFNIEQVSVVVDDQYRVAKDGSGNWLLANATDANAQEALLITDVLTTGSDLGSNLIVGIDRVRFLDGELRTGVTESTYTQDDNGIIFIEIQQHGSAFGERLSFKVDSNGTVMDVNNNLRGNGGNDTLIGAMNGDILNGGLGDDLLIGAGNGDSANEWRDLDRAEYDVSTWARLTVDGVRVGYDHTSHTLLLDANGDILFNPNSTQLTGTGYQLTSAYQVTDVVSSDQGGFGSDILIGVERLSITGSEINLGVTTQLHDWDSDGSVDNAEVRGSDFNDTILSMLEGGDVEDAAFLARSNNINAEGGDDNVYAGAGGDWIRLGTGNDFVDGGSNDGTNNWGGANIDQVRFNNNQANYTLSSTSFDGTEHLLHDLDGLLVFKVQADGQIMRMSTTGDTQLLGQVLQGEKFTLVQDKTPSGELAGEGTNLLIGIEELSFNDNWMRLQQDIGVRYNQDGDVQNGWTNGTGISDTMVGHSYSDEFNGEAGDDLMVGAGGGDRFNGGAGDDIMLGGANGTTGNDWDDLDRADYWQFDSQRAVITKVKVGMHSDGSNLLLDTDNNLILAPSNQLLGSNYQLVDAYQVMDIVADNYGGFGTDTLVGVERIYFKDSQVDLLISTQERDWNNDGLTDWTQVSGTNMADTIGLVSQGGTIASTSFMNASNYIRSGDGDDSIWAMSGDDTIRPEGGNDYINGGNLKDTVEFSGAESRYVITNYTFNDQEIDIIDSSGTAVFKVLNDGSVLRVNSDGTTTTLDTITSGQKLTQVADLMPGGILGGDGTNLMINVENIGFKGSHMSLEVDRNLNYNNGVLQNSWINGTHGNDSASDLMGTIVGDSINGNAGDDVLVGLQGNDRLRGGAGDDILWGDIEGSATSLPGRDEAQYNGVEGQFTITKGEHTVNGVVLQYVQVSDALSATLGGEGTDTLYGIEALNFTDSWVRIGVELYQHADDNGTVTYRHYQGSQFADTITGSEIGDNITGGQGNDLIYGGVGGDRIAGGEGSDIIYGGEEGIDAWGNARVDVAVFKGNWIDYSIQHWNASGQLSGTYDTAGHMTIQLVTTDNTGAVDTLYGIERLEFDDRSMSFKSSQNFTDANGDGVPDWAEIRGTDSADTIDGSAMADVIYGDAGDDILNGNTGNDQLSGDAGNDTIDGGSGQDVFGNSYVDTAIYTGNYAEYVITTADNVTWTVSANGETDTLSNIEVLRFADMSANLVGDVSTRDYNKDGIVDFANLAGTLGNDTFDVTNTDGFSASGWAPPDHLTSLDYYIALGDGNDNATLGSGNDTIKDLLGSDNYDGGSGFDTLQLSALWSEWSVTNNGDNTYSVAQLDGSTSNNKVISNIEQVQFNDRIITLVATSNALDIDQDGTADNMIYTGSDTDDVLNAAENMSISWQLNGNMGDDIISGSDVGDRLNGGTGNDTLSGGLGHDIAIYGSLAEQSTISQVVMIDDGSGNLIEDIAVTPTGTTHGYKVVSGLDEDSQTDYLIDIEGIEFSDGVVSLVNTEQILSSFSLTNGIQETRYEQGTRYDDDLTTSAYIDQLTGGTGNDTFNIIESGFQYSHITDFEGLDSDGGVHDLLTFNSTDDNSLFGVDVSTWASTDAAGKSDIIANLLKMATFDSASGNATFNFANHTLTLDNTTANDLSANNIDIV